MPETNQSTLPGSNLDPTVNLPLSLLRSDTIPPNPSQSPSTVDWLPDFAGHSWIAYGASSLLVISHLPSPLSVVESRLAPFLRLVFHLPSTLSAVSWSPVTPSTGELAAASDHCIFLFSNDSSTSAQGSFCWSQNAVLVQSTKVEAIKWAGSGDGLIVGGFDVVLWRRRNKSWEIAWKFKLEQPQTLVSTTWSIGGCSASAAFPSGVHVKESNNTNTHVMVCYGNGASEFASTELRHPQPVTMIQWRQLTGRRFKGNANRLLQNVLLTCCLDGTVRLWTEVDHGKVRKQGRENNSDQKAIKRSFYVAAVLEINNALQGALGIDISLAWAIDNDGFCRTREGVSRFFSVEEHGNLWVGRCEWLVGLGPGALITFWAVHCLDDTLPVRFPRVTLWKKQQIPELESQQLHCSGFSKLEDNLLLSKVVILRTCPSAPPTVCSLIRLSRCSYLTRLVLDAETSSNTQEKSSNQQKIDRYSTSSTSNIVSVGHSGKILQVAIHPNFCEVELVVSLDSNGLLLFWSISKFADTKLGLSTLIPIWENCKEFGTRNSCSKYTCLKWAPSVKDDDRILLMGHAGGIDCFIVEVCQNEKRINCHYLCTIPLSCDDTLEDGPSDIFGIPLSSTCSQTFKYNNFMLLGLWPKGFRALSWEVTVHSYDSCGSCSTCGFDDIKTKEGYLWKFENNLSNKRYCLGVNVCSSQLPEPHSRDHVTSYSVISPDNLIPVQENPNFSKDLNCRIPAYVMATGCSDGSLKLWRSNSSKESTDIPWELVGKLIAFEGAIHSICVAGLGQKIATVCAGSHLGGPSILRIWETLHFIGGGTFMLEDELYIDGDVVACKWLGLGNGQFLLGISLQNELQVYAKKHLDGFALINPVNNRNGKNWSCIAVSQTQSANCDFVWGPRATAVVIHDNYLSLLSQLLGINENQTKSCLKFVDKDYEVEKKMEPFSSPITGHDDDVAVSRESSAQNYLIGNWSIIEVAENYMGVLQVFHPKALLMNLCSGNWKRAYVSVKHLVDFLIDASERKSGSGKCSHVPQVALSSYLEGVAQKYSTGERFHWNADSRLSTSSLESFVYNSNFDPSSSMFGSSSTKSEIANFIDTLEKLYFLVGFGEEEKLQVLAIVDLLGEVQHSSSAFQNLDEAGRRFWVQLRFQQLHYLKRFGRLPSVEEMVVDARLTNWAFHSDCQETLLSSFLPSEPSWKQMQTLGVGFWYTNVAELRTRMEKLARLQYLRKKDPKDCALLYIALNRHQVLAGLFKLSKDEKDKPLVGFLLRNFQEEKHKAAALKNAYVLLGRHQIELAIAFFLLGGDTYSAVTVCAKNLGDEQLALVICRLIDGPGGSLEHQLITKLMLPSAIARGDYWVTALLEWRLGNYYESIMKMLGCHGSSAIYRYALSYNHLAFLDPHIGLYCLLLTTKTSVKNAIGESTAAILGRWATIMAAKAFANCGLSLEALECASSRTIPLSMDQRATFNNNHSQILRDILKPTALDSFNWLSDNVALHLESFAKTDLALQYFSMLMKEHPRWCDTVAASRGYGTSYTDIGMQQDVKLVENFREKICTGLGNLEKFSIPSSRITQMMLIWLCNNGLGFLGYDLTLDCSSHYSSLDIGLSDGGQFSYPHQLKQVWKAVQDTSLLWSRFSISSCMSCFILCYKENDKDVSVKLQAICSYNWDRYVKDILGIFSSLRACMRIIFSSLSEDISRILSILDLFEFYVHVASAWHLQDSEDLLSMVQPFLINWADDQIPYQFDLEKLKEIIRQPKQLLGSQKSKDDARTRSNIIGYVSDSEDGQPTPSADNEKWLVIGTCVWQHMARLMKQVFQSLSINLEESFLSDPSSNTISSLLSVPADAGEKSIKEQIEFFTMLLADLFKTTTMYISSYHLKMLGSLVQWKVVNGLQAPILEWLRESNVAQVKTHYQGVNRGTMNSEDEKIVDILWNTLADPGLVSEGFAEEKISWSHLVNQKSSKSWNEIYKSMTAEHKTQEILDNEVTVSNNSPSNEDQTTSKGLFKNTRTFLSSWQKDVVISKEDSQFENAKEIYNGEGERLEALCINSTNEQEGAIASSRKGIIFFNWEDWLPCRDQSNYIWSDADWPLNGWAGTRSTPIPTCVSPGVGLGRKKGGHLGLGGATIGVDSSAKPFRDLTGGGAFGIPGYAGIGASGLGWEVQDEFEEFVDPPATVENINTRAFSTHPSRPFFLVGSSNTHIYLWEFGKDSASATYGVLPAANVPPPYALASISALQFDHYGHRFATAALDGTVCTWQLEVGGRSNIHPTESSLCFSGHASDVTYITSSGSIIAAAGSSSSNNNVVIWDTLASSTTSQVPIRCHEGGARSIAVFDDNIGSGSVAPLIVTGGKEGDVAVHDFRYVVTGKTKRLKHSGSSNGGSNPSSNADMQTRVGKSGEKNVDGMLWYLPKAHLGGVTKVVTIPHTSLFLTGSKDGDVKLWDAKAAKMVWHWPKLHDRRTFLEPNTRGFGGVVRAAVTDIQVVSHGFLTCGADGSVKLVKLKNHSRMVP